MNIETDPIRTIDDLPAATPVEVDTALADLDRRQASVGSWLAGRIGKPLLSITPQRAADMVNLLAALHGEIGRLEGEWERRQWSRYIVVNGGHVHAGWFCRGGSIRWNTQRDHYPQLSGATVDEAIAKLDVAMCTKCFPDAPVAERQRPADECPGSGMYLDTEKPHRTGYAAGNWATCARCEQRVGVGATGKLRKHDTVAATARKVAAKLKESGKIKIGREAKTVRAWRIEATDKAYWALYSKHYAPSHELDRGDITEFARIVNALGDATNVNPVELSDELWSKAELKHKSGK